jgi:hypothetical protein
MVHHPEPALRSDGPASPTLRMTCIWSIPAVVSWEHGPVFRTALDGRKVPLIAST